MKPIETSQNNKYKIISKMKINKQLKKGKDKLSKQGK